MSEYKNFGISMERKVLSALDNARKKTGSKSRSEFITEAVLHYVATQNVNDISKILSPAVESSIRAANHESENHISSMLFKLAVEIDMMMHVTAATNDIDETTLSKLRGECVQEVKSSLGRISFDSAVRIQKG